MKKELVKKMCVSTFMLLCSIVVDAQNYHFSSYHVYTNDDDKYLTSNVQNDSSKVCINEANQEIEFCLYNRDANKWMTFALKVNSKMDIGFNAKIGTLYMCTNNANQTCGVCIVNINEGTFIDLHNFFVSDRPMSCWVKENE